MCERKRKDTKLEDVVPISRARQGLGPRFPVTLFTIISQRFPPMQPDCDVREFDHDSCIIFIVEIIVIMTSLSWSLLGSTSIINN